MERLADLEDRINADIAELEEYFIIQLQEQNNFYVQSVHYEGDDPEQWSYLAEEEDDHQGIEQSNDDNAETQTES